MSTRISNIGGGGGSEAYDSSGATIITDESVAGTVYTGVAEGDPATSSAVWRIRRTVQTISGSVTEYVTTSADGDDAFDNVWDNRASLSYS